MHYASLFLLLAFLTLNSVFSPFPKRVARVLLSSLFPYRFQAQRLVLICPTFTAHVPSFASGCFLSQSSLPNIDPLTAVTPHSRDIVSSGLQSYSTTTFMAVPSVCGLEVQDWSYCMAFLPFQSLGWRTTVNTYSKYIHCLSFHVDLGSLC